MLRSYYAVALLASVVLVTSAVAQDDPYAEPAEPGLPASNMELDFPRVALVVTDPQIDFRPGINNLSFGAVDHQASLSRLNKHQFIQSGQACRLNCARFSSEGPS